MRKIFFLIICVTIINISCQKKGIDGNFTKPIVDTLYEKPKVYFDDDNIEDNVQVIAKPDKKILNYEISVYLSTLPTTIEMPILNNSVLYNNNYSVYYVSDPVIEKKTIKFQVDYPDQEAVSNNLEGKKNLVEKFKIRFNAENKRIQIIGYEVNYTKGKIRNYSKSFNFITGKYYASSYFDGEKKEVSGWSSKLQNIYIENWDYNFLNNLLFYGNEIE